MLGSCVWGLISLLGVDVRIFFLNFICEFFVFCFLMEGSLVNFLLRLFNVFRIEVDIFEIGVDLDFFF